MKLLLVVCAAIFLGCVGAQQRPIRAVAVLNGDDIISGTVHFTQSGCGQSVFVEVNVRGLNTIGHGFHIHETGDLTNGCTSLAAHYNPHEVNHAGRENITRHVGDLGNIYGDAIGFSTVTFRDEMISLSGSRNVIGRGVIVHLNVDDLGKGDHPDSLTTGNAGPRVACGVIGYVNGDEPFDCPRSSANTQLAAVVLTFFAVIAALFRK